MSTCNEWSALAGGHRCRLHSGHGGLHEVVSAHTHEGHDLIFWRWDSEIAGDNK
jgi:hypothetical protein